MEVIILNISFKEGLLLILRAVINRETVIIQGNTVQ